METIIRKIGMAAIVLTLLVSGCAKGGTSTELIPDVASIAWEDLSEAEQLAVTAQLEQYRQNHGVSPDFVAPEPIRVLPQAGIQVAWMDCVIAEGFDVELTPDGVGIVWQGDASQAEPYREAYFSCMARYPLRSDQNGQPVTDAEFLRSYEYQTQTVPECLSEFDITVENVPSFEVWKATGYWPELEQAFSRLSQAKYYAVSTKCPQNTPPEVLYMVAAEK